MSFERCIRPFLLSNFAVLSVGCGEVTKLELDIRPSQVEFGAVKQALITVGCARQGCHVVLTGDFELNPDDNSLAQLETEYLLAKAFVDLDDPDKSILVRVALKGDPAAQSHRLCFDSDEACVYRKVDAWLRAQGPDDPSVDDIDCEPVEGACSKVR